MICSFGVSPHGFILGPCAALAQGLFSCTRSGECYGFCMSEILRRIAHDGKIEHTFQWRPHFSGIDVMQYTHTLRQQARQFHDMALEITSIPCCDPQTAVKLLIRRQEQVS